MLRQWVADDKPIWGTCAGMILLSNTALVQKEGGQVLQLLELIIIVHTPANSDSSGSSSYCSSKTSCCCSIAQLECAHNIH
jgi:glutamine amidotransferase PdxT